VNTVVGSGAAGRLSTGRQALPVLAHLRNGTTYAQLAAGFEVGTSTVYRYISEAVDLLAALAPTLDEAVRAASAKAYVLLDGTLLPIDRIAADRPHYSGKHKKHGMNVQGIADAFGRLLGLTCPAGCRPRHQGRTHPRHHRSSHPSRHPDVGRQGISGSSGESAPCERARFRGSGRGSLLQVPDLW